MHSDKSGKALDLNIALTHADGDSQLLSELASIFLQDYPRLIEDAHRSLLEKDYSDLERAAHTLKGRLSFFGIAALRDQVQALEAMGRDKDLSGAPQALAEIELGMKSILSDFEALIPPQSS